MRVLLSAGGDAGRLFSPGNWRVAGDCEGNGE
jgi:hypothetical protein